MDGNELYVFPKLLFNYKELAPAISEEQLTLHHTKHHQAMLPGQTQSSGNLTRPGKRTQIST